MTSYRINLSRLLCQVLNGEFRRNDGLLQESRNFAAFKNGLYTKNLIAWKVGSLYFGMETQAAYFDEARDSAKYFYPSTHPLYGAHDVRQDIKEEMINSGAHYKGTVHLSAQVADMQMKASPASSSRYTDCAGVLSSNDQVNLAEDLIIGSTAKPPPPPPAASCESGSFISAAGEGIEWMCNCTAADPIFHRSGWYRYPNNCYQRTADSFCGGGRVVYWVCNQKSHPSGPGWVPVPNNCYHLGTTKTCN